MHGRMVFLTLLIAALLPAVARADAVTLHAGDRAPFDGVVTEYQAIDPGPSGFHLEAVQHLAGGGQTVLSSVDVAGGPPGAGVGGWANLPMGRDSELVADGASPGVSLTAKLEPDADGDGWPDGSIDRCPADATTHLLPCPGVQSFGSPLHLRPDPNGFSASGNPMAALQTAGPAAVGAPVGGVLVRWRFRSATTAPLTLQVLRPAGGGAYRVVGESAATTPAGGGAVTTATVRLPIAAGDRIGVRSPGDLGAVAATPAALGEQVGVFDPVPAAGSTATPASSAGFRLLSQADTEPDADADGYGDATQDGCPFDASRQSGCAADLAVTAATPAQVVAPGADVTVGFTVTNRGPDPAYLARVELGQTPLQAFVTAACSGTPCEVTRLAPGASLTGRWTLSGAQLLAIAAKDVTLTGTASSRTADPDASNNTASAAVSVRATAGPSPSQPATATPKPCAHLVRGTGDDDFLRGSAFSDRLVGLDGVDLLRAYAGDDCLEGGNGGDVLDAGAGNDRLSGGAGNDRLSGGTGDDKLTGGGGNDRLTGGPGSDTLLPGKGKDIVSAGSGNDTISAADGVRESIDCGPGRDTVRADRRDRLRHCEKVTRVGRR